MYNIFKLLINNLSKYKNTLKSVFLKHIKLFITIPFYTLFNFFILLLYTKQIINITPISGNLKTLSNVLPTARLKIFIII